MARSDEVLYSGEVWTDGRGYATVVLSRASGAPLGAVHYDLRPAARGVTASIAAQLLDGRFAIVTDEPHVKVAWRVLGRRPHLDGKEELP